MLKKVIKHCLPIIAHTHTHTECVSVRIIVTTRTRVMYFSPGMDGESVRPVDSCYRTNFSVSKRETGAYQRPEKGEIRSLHSTLMELKYRVQICQREA